MIYEIHHLSFRYTAEHVLDEVDLAIEAGEFVSIIGPNGAGKSTLLRLMAGLARGFDGDLRFDGRPISSYRSQELARQLAFVPQETHVVFPFTASEMVLMGRQGLRAGFLFDTDSDVSEARQAMELTGTLHLASRVFNELSGGERQRVVLASGLAQRPRVLLLDEPTVYLDLRHQLEFYGILGRLNREGMTVIAVSHDVNLSARVAGRMVILDAGHIVDQGPPDEVLTPAMFEAVFKVRAEIVAHPGGGRYVIPTA